MAKKKVTMWLSLDPRTKKVEPYPETQSNLLEEAFLSRRHGVDAEVYLGMDFYCATVHFPADEPLNAVREFVKKNRTRRRRIFVRTGSDCNMCINCKNKKRLGGPGQRKHACKNRRIESITYANDAA